MEKEADSVRWVAVHRGSLASVLVLKGELEANEILCDVPDASVGSMDPFMRGGNVFEYELRVLDRFVAQARELVHGWTPMELQAAERAQFDPYLEPTMPAVDGSREELSELRRRIRRMSWSSITLPFAPYCLALAPGYFRSAARAELTRRERWMTLSAVAFAAAFSLSVVMLVVGV